jgi:hypothetical protein
MTRSEEDDDSTIIDISAGDGRKLVTPAKTEQLRAARVKALESRKKSQAAALEQRLMEVRQWLGQHVDSGVVEKVQNTILDQARDLHRKQKQTLSSFTQLLSEESTKRAQESASLRKSIEKMRGEVEQLKTTYRGSKMPSIPEQVKPKAPSTVVTAASTSSKGSVSTKASVPLSQVKERQLL